MKQSFKHLNPVGLLQSLSLVALVLLLFCGKSYAYDPLKVADTNAPDTLDLTVHDDERSRDIPFLVYLPKSTMPQPVVLFSHGLGGSRFGSKFLGEHWARRGYVAVFIQHPGSDESVWKDKPRLKAMQDMRDAASVQNFFLRVKDVPMVIDELERLDKAAGGPLNGRMDMKHIGMSGHSFGAVTTQAVSGEYFSHEDAYTDPRIIAAMPFSPSLPKMGTAEAAFGHVKIPWMLMTGTEDAAPIGNNSPESRREVYKALPAGNKYELVLNKAEHSVFTERALPLDHEPRNPKHHPAIMALSTAFWDAYLRDDSAARKWLDSADARSVLEPEDLWQHK